MTTEETTLLIRRLLESITDFHADLAIDYREMHGRVDWRVLANINDQGKLVGRLASHIKAVRYIVEELGARVNLDYRIRLEEPKSGERLPPQPKRTARPGYKPDHLVQLLHDILTAILDVPPAIVVNRNDTGWVFTINAAQIQDYEKLVEPVEGDESGMTVLTALGTLFRAAGHKDGIVLQLEVPSR